MLEEYMVRKSHAYKSPFFSHYQYTTNFNNGTWIQFIVTAWAYQIARGEGALKELQLGLDSVSSKSPLTLSSSSSNTSLQEVDSDNEALTPDCISVDSKSNKINETTSKSRAKLLSLDIEVSFDYNYVLFTAVHSLCVKLSILHLEHSTTCWSCHFL